MRSEAEITLRATIRRPVQINGDHSLSYDRDGLVRILDEELGRSRR